MRNRIIVKLGKRSFRLCQQFMTIGQTQTQVFDPLTDTVYPTVGDATDALLNIQAREFALVAKSTIKCSELSTLRMGSNEKGDKHKFVIDRDGWVKHYVGIGWVNHKQVEASDFELYPVVVEG